MKNLLSFLARRSRDFALGVGAFALFILAFLLAASVVGGVIEIFQGQYTDGARRLVLVIGHTGFWGGIMWGGYKIGTVVDNYPEGGDDE